MRKKGTDSGSFPGRERPPGALAPSPQFLGAKAMRMRRPRGPPVLLKLEIIVLMHAQIHMHTRVSLAAVPHRRRRPIGLRRLMVVLRTLGVLTQIRCSTDSQRA